MQRKSLRLMEATSPVVRVVTTGADRPAIAAAIATGVGGLASIVATFPSGQEFLG